MGQRKQRSWMTAEHPHRGPQTCLEPGRGSTDRMPEANEDYKRFIQ